MNWYQGIPLLCKCMGLSRLSTSSLLVGSFLDFIKLLKLYQQPIGRFSINSIILEILIIHFKQIKCLLLFLFLHFLVNYFHAWQLGFKSWIFHRTYRNSNTFCDSCYNLNHILHLHSFGSSFKCLKVIVIFQLSTMKC